MNAPKRILFIKLAEQGSTVLAQGALNAAISASDAKTSISCCLPRIVPILDALKLIPAENVIEIRARGLWQTVCSALAAVWRMRSIGIDVAIDLEFFARASAALSYLSGARQRVGYHAFGGEASSRGNLMTHRLSFNPYLHTSQTFQIMVQALDCDPAELPTFEHTGRPPVDPVAQFQAVRGGSRRGTRPD